jgi:hypothetical protein
MRKLSRGRVKMIRSHVRRYRWVATILGALLVFGTFIVRDLKRDELKSLMDSLSATETSYLIRRDIQAINDPNTRSFSTDNTHDSLEAATRTCSALSVTKSSNR